MAKSLNSLKKPANLFALALGIYAIIASIFTYGQHGKEIFVSFGVLFTISTLGYFIVNYFKNLNYINFLISTIIFYLIIHPTANVITLISIATLFVLFKFVRYKNMPIINPVVLASLALYLLSHIFSFFDSPPISWWGASFLDPWSILFLLPALYVSSIKIPKYWYFLSFFLTFFALTTLIDDFQSHWILTGPLYFAIGIMALEIKTSPLKRNDQIIFGISGGIILFIAFSLNWAYAYLMSIFIINLLLFGKKFLLK